jgi:hypothetical protein
VIKNQAGQTASALVLDVVTGLPFVGVVTCYVTGDGGTQTLGSVGSGIATAEGNGTYTYTPSAAETNYSNVIFTFTGGSGSINGQAQYEPITAAQAAAISSATVTSIGDGPTRIELLSQLAYRLNKTPPPNMDSLTQARLVSFLNQRQRRLLTMPGMKRLRDATVTMASVADQPAYALANIAKVTRMSETTNDRVLYEMSHQDYRLTQPDTTITGTPQAFVWTGRQVVARQPADASALFVQSSSASDTSVTVYVEGVITGGYPQSTSITLTGTTAVNIASTVSTWERVDKFYLSVAAVGSVTLTEDSGVGTTLAVIAAGQTNPNYTGLLLWPTPSSAITYTIDITRAVTDLTHDTDVAAIPDDFADLLVLGALADEYQHLADARWSAAVAEYKEREGQLKYWLAETATGRPFGLGREWERPSQLGSMYPAGS